MKTNLPVTQNELMLKAGGSIVSKTDLKGLITYVNQDFVDISGFTEAELIGQSHNIVRHPDMPPEAFADLWATLKAERPWTGLVKNRCKNGDYYWVLANVTPIFQNDTVIGYLSVRSAPSRGQVEAAETAYRNFREGRAAGLAIREGAVVKTAFSLGDWLKGRTISQRLLALFSLLTAGMLLIGALGLLSVGEGNQRLHTVYSDSVVPLQQLKEVTDAYALLIVSRTQKMRDGAMSFEAGLSDIEAAQALIHRHWQGFSASRLMAEEEKKLIVATNQLMLESGLAITRLKEILAAKNASALASFAATELYPAVDPIIDKLNQLSALQGHKAKLQADTAGDIAANLMTRIALVFLAMGALGIFLASRLLASVRRPIKMAAAFFRALSEGRNDVHLDFVQRDELLAIADSARTLQIKSGFDLSEARRVADAGMRIKRALDGSGTAMTISNESNVLIYMNASAEALWRKMEPEMRVRVPGFSVDKLYQHSLVDFFDDDIVKAAYRLELTESRTFDVQMCGRSLQVTASPVRDDHGKYLGRASQWIDRTEEVAVENELAGIVSGAARGDFKRRVTVDGKLGFFLRLAKDLNLLMQTSEVGLDDVAQVLSGLAEGDLTRQISANYEGTFGQLKNDANQTVAQLKEIILQFRQATDAINTAAREIAGGNHDLSRRTEEQASSLEETASSMEQLTSTVKHNADNARQANELADNAQQVAIQGGEVVGQVVLTMRAIHQSSHRIADIIGVIDGIAFQTNILALNAAVEAARAGEQGRGFAVVATEVRNLAKRSADAAKEIKGLISDSVDKVENGNRQVAQAGRTMEQVVASIKQVAKIMTDISNASVEQSVGIEQVGLAVSQMDEVTQQNAALVEQAAAAAESLEEQALQLAQAVAIFKLSAASGSVKPRLKEAPSQSKAPHAGAGKKPAALPASLDDQWEEF